jgi:hypothetical protein
VPEPTTTVATPRWVRAALWLGIPPACAGVLLLLVLLLRWSPIPVPFGVVHDMPLVAAIAGSIVVGVLGGALLAGAVDAESLSVHISSASIELIRPDVIRTVPRSEVKVAFTDRDRLVLLGPTGRELAGEPCHLSAQRLKEAFTSWQIEWAERDPYLPSYQRWVPSSPELPARVEALLAERQRALSSRDDRDCRELREELGRLGYVIRDDRQRQYWRQAAG